MNEPSFLFDSNSNDAHGIHQLSKSSPSQLPPFLFKRSSRQESTTSKAPSLSHVPCKFFKQGTCTAGANCIFSHNPDATSEAAVCRYYLKGTCKFGTKCALLHTLAVNGRKGRQPSIHHQPQPQHHSLQQQYHHHQHLHQPQQHQQQHHQHQQQYSTSPHPPGRFQSLHPHQTRQRMYSSSSSSSSSGVLDTDGSFDDVNDAMLPSSLNDLLTPSELQLRRAREQEDLLIEQYSSLPARTWSMHPTQSSIGSKSSWLDDYKLAPSRPSDTHDPLDLTDDDVQFFMEDDQPPPDKKQQHHTPTPFVFPALIPRS